MTRDRFRRLLGVQGPLLFFILILPVTSILAILDAGDGRTSDHVLETLLLPEPRIDELKAKGPAVLPAIARLYERSNARDRAVIATAFYRLGWKSPDAKRVLMQDVHTDDQNLRLQVQWALGRVSNDPDVVDVLLDNMQHDGNPLFRDKAACALADDQIHLTQEQKVYLFGRLIQALRDPNPQVRDIAIKVLAIHTGQNKGYEPNAPLGQREQRIQVWERWLDEYKANL
jgi:HEAT repeat protein